MKSQKNRIMVGCGIALIVAMFAWDFVDGFKGQHSVKAGLVSLGGGILSFLIYNGLPSAKSKDDGPPTV